LLYVLENKIIQVKNLYKKYGNLIAVDNVSFDVYKGEIFGLLGSNGAGKTTTLEIIETLKDETSGDVIVGGFSINENIHEIRKLIGVQLQDAGFYPRLTISQLLDLFAGLYNMSIQKQKILDLVGLRDKANEIVKNLSGGQKQRFSLAITLMNSPKIVFLDEPSVGLDPNSRIHLWEVIRRINKEGTTVVLTTHYMEEAHRLCDRVAIMEKGEISALDTPDRLIKQYGVEETERELEQVYLKITK
jgi:ABC-2 type transport system ATP-binding protein